MLAGKICGLILETERIRNFDNKTGFLVRGNYERYALLICIAWLFDYNF